MTPMDEQQLRKEIHQFMEDYKNRPSNANKSYHGILALFKAELAKAVTAERNRVLDEIISVTVGELLSLKDFSSTIPNLTFYYNQAVGMKIVELRTTPLDLTGYHRDSTTEEWVDNKEGGI